MMMSLMLHSVVSQCLSEYGSPWLETCLAMLLNLPFIPLLLPCTLFSCQCLSLDCPFLSHCSSQLPNLMLGQRKCSIRHVSPVWCRGGLRWVVREISQCCKVHQRYPSDSTWYLPSLPSVAVSVCLLRTVDHCLFFGTEIVCLILTFIPNIVINV